MNEFPSLLNILQSQHDHLDNVMLDELVDAIMSKMEKIIKSTTSPFFHRNHFNKESRPLRTKIGDD